MNLFSGIVVLLVMTNCCESTIVQSTFQYLDSRQNIRGDIGATEQTRSLTECAFRCLLERNCTTYQYKESQPGNCVLIQKHCFGEQGQIVENAIYEKVNNPIFHADWNPPSGWTEPEAAFYQSFDSSNCLTLIEGSVNRCEIPLVVGKVNFALNLDRTKRQWVDLGIHTEACMTRPETCGTAGGAISLWLNLIDCSEDAVVGIVSSHDDKSSGLTIWCISGFLAVTAYLPYRRIKMLSAAPSGWTHLLLNYDGLNSYSSRMRMFYDGAEVTSASPVPAEFYSMGDGRIVVGRRFTDRDLDYVSVQVDELIYFNQSLSNDDINALYTAV